jgi:hypothetical protein
VKAFIVVEAHDLGGAELLELGLEPLLVFDGKLNVALTVILRLGRPLLGDFLHDLSCGRARIIALKYFSLLLRVEDVSA